MTIQVDTREKQHAIQNILATFDENRVKHFDSKLYVGDYCNLENPLLVVDRKQNLSELCQNVCQGHDRFVRELVRAQDAGIKMIVLAEHSAQIRCLEDVVFWVNPRLKVSPKACTGQRLYKILRTMSREYNVDFEFCDKRQTGRRIIELLSNDQGRN